MRETRENTGMAKSADTMGTEVLARLAATVAERARAPSDGSYTASLLAKGTPKCAQKLGEEAVETVIAALGGDRAAVAAEAADLLYHLLVTLQSVEVPLGDVMAELERREGRGGLEEKAARSGR
jgi:phosphoribosyl-ATP pyrophosphohydrolase